VQLCIVLFAKSYNRSIFRKTKIEAVLAEIGNIYIFHKYINLGVKTSLPLVGTFSDFTFFIDFLLVSTAAMSLMTRRQSRLYFITVKI